jgi:low temperature requirement protein LtrA
MSDSLRQRFAQSFHFTESAPHDISYHPGRLLLYSPPRQRQIWGESQVLPRVNWGDLFFDLFYVAATYNVSNILSQDPNARGILYSLATFLPCMAFWNERTLYHARFVVIEDDLFHRLLTTIMLVVLAVLVMHIRPIPDMADSLSMFLFTLMLVAERKFQLCYMLIKFVACVLILEYLSLGVFNRCIS